MATSYKNWTVRGYVRERHDWTADGERFPLHSREIVVAIFSPDGRAWEVVLDGERLVELTIHGPTLDTAAVRAVPVSILKEIARGYLHDFSAHHDGGDVPLGVALDIADRDPGQVEVSGQLPGIADFAEVWQATPAATIDTATGRRVTRRHALAARYGVSPATVDKATRRARDLGLIERATTGRPRQKPPGKTTTRNRRKGK